jgi:hypothetical protein
MTVVDLGCGDYSVGQQLVSHCARYVGVDIVRPLVEYNQATYGSEHVSFKHANIVADELPSGDICLLRQVLQHLSNDQILAVLPKLNRFRWTFISEHQASPSRLRTANIDKPHGGGIRAGFGSGVFLDRPPFNIPSDRLRVLLEVPGTALQGGVDPGVIRTYVLAGDP